MKKLMNKVFSIMMAFIMIAALIPLAAFGTAEEVRAADSQSVSVSGIVNGQSVTLTVGPFVTDITSKEGTASLTSNVSGGSNPTITWSSSDPETVSVKYGTVTGHRRGSAIITATLTELNGQAIPEAQQISANVKVNVEFDIRQYAEQGTPTNYEYPNLGGVRIKKTASSDMMENYGLSEVELDVAGIGLRPGVDVVLVVDVSNSMGWSLERSGNTGGDENRIAINGQETKLRKAMKAAKAFSKIMLEDNKGNSKYDNTVSFVTFAGQDTDYSVSNSDQQTYVDACKTIFAGETDLAKASASFDGTDMTSVAYVPQGHQMMNVDYTLTVKNTDGNSNAIHGLNRGNTNYDYAFVEASKAVDAARSAYENKYNESYTDSKRDTYVIFMTDGAPSHYNRTTAAGSGRDQTPDTNDWDRIVYNDNNQYPNQSDWTNYITHNVNTYADALYRKIATPGKTSSNLYAVGFDLAHGGFIHGTGSWQWDENTLVGFLEDMVGDDIIPVSATAEDDELTAIYERLAKLMKPAGTQAQVTDQVNTDLFTLQTQGFVIGDIESGGGTTINLPLYAPKYLRRRFIVLTGSPIAIGGIFFGSISFGIFFVSKPFGIFPALFIICTSLLLRVVDLLIYLVFLEKLFMAADSIYLTVVKDDYLIGVLNRGYSLSYDYLCGIGYHFRKRLAYE